MHKIIKIIIAFIALMSISSIHANQSKENNQVLSFMITNEGIKKGRIKIKQRSDESSPYLIIGCNHKNEDFEVMIGNIDQKEFSDQSYTVTTHFKIKSYKDTFIPIYKDNLFYLTKKTNKLKDNQLFVYQYLRYNQVIIEFPKNVVFYFNSKSATEFTEYMNIIVSHCEMKF